jgi:hypothetical protein
MTMDASPAMTTSYPSPITVDVDSSAMMAGPAKLLPGGNFERL